MALPYIVDWTRRSTNNGYSIVFTENHPRSWSTGYVYEHILKIESFIDRLLEEGEVVHHKDKNKMNNALENLELMTPSEHSKLHGKETEAAMVDLVCQFCGVEFKRLRRQSSIVKGYARNFCSRRCFGLGK